MALSEKGHRQSIREWLISYWHEESAVLALSSLPKKDGVEMFAYYKKHLNLDVSYEELFKELFNIDIKIEQIDEKTKNILRNGDLSCTVKQEEKETEITFWDERSGNKKYKRLDMLDDSIFIEKFDENTDKKVLEANGKDGKIVESTGFYESGKVSFENKYDNGKVISTMYYGENGRKMSLVHYDTEKNVNLLQEFHDDGTKTITVFDKEGNIVSKEEKLNEEILLEKNNKDQSDSSKKRRSLFHLIFQ